MDVELVNSENLGHWFVWMFPSIISLCFGFSFFFGFIGWEEGGEGVGVDWSFFMSFWAFCLERELAITCNIILDKKEKNSNLKFSKDTKAFHKFFWIHSDLSALFSLSLIKIALVFNVLNLRLDGFRKFLKSQFILSFKNKINLQRESLMAKVI